MYGQKPGTAGGGRRDRKGGPLVDEDGNTVLSVDGMIAGKMPHGRGMTPGNGPYDGQKKLRYSAKPGRVGPYVGDNLIEMFMPMIIYPLSEICKRNLKIFFFKVLIFLSCK